MATNWAMLLNRPTWSSVICVMSVYVTNRTIINDRRLVTSFSAAGYEYTYLLTYLDVKSWEICSNPTLENFRNAATSKNIFTPVTYGLLV